MRCPKCESDNTKKLSLIVDEGTYEEESVSETVVSGTTRSYGGGSYSVGSTSASGVTTTQTSGASALAKKMAAPGKKSPIAAGLIGLVLAAVVGFLFGGLLSEVVEMSPSTMGATVVAAWVLLGALAIRRALTFWRYNRDEWPALYERWSRSFHCGRCGEVFEQA